MAIRSSLSQLKDEIVATALLNGIELPEHAGEPLARYCSSLWAWNEKINLTRHDDVEKFVTRDLVDVGELSKLIETGETVLDVGSGGGVPGIPLAILRPDITVVLNDSIAKKAHALQEIVRESALQLEVLHGAAQKITADRYFDVLTIRAVAALEKLCQWFRPVAHNWGRVLIVKGPKWVEERQLARQSNALKDFDLRKVCEYARQGMDAPSVVLRLTLRDN